MWWIHEAIKCDRYHKTGIVTHLWGMVKNECSRQNRLGVARKTYRSTDTRKKSSDAANNGHFSYSCHSKVILGSILF